MLHKISSALAAIMYLAAVVSSSASAATADKVTVLFVTTLSGPLTEAGQAHLRGFQLGMEMAGGKLGGLPVQTIIVDDKFDPEVAVQGVRKALDTGTVNFVTGTLFSNVLTAVVKPVEDSKTLFISSFSGTIPMSGSECNPYFFDSGYQIEAPYEAVGAAVSAQRNIKSVFILAPNYVGGRDAVAGFKKTYKGAISGELYTQVNQPDYSAELAQVRNAKPDAVFVFYPGSMGITFVRQFAAAQLGVPLYSGATIDELSLPAIGAAAKGTYSSAVYNQDVKSRENAAFVAAWKKKYSTDPSPYAALGYDVVPVLDAAVRAAHGNLKDTEAIRRGLRADKFNLATGPMRFNENQFAIVNVYLVEPVESPDGQWHLKYAKTIFTDHKDSESPKCSMRR